MVNTEMSLSMRDHVFGFVVVFALTLAFYVIAFGDIIERVIDKILAGGP